LEKCAADLEQYQAEHGAAEEQLHKTKQANAQLRKDLAFFEEANKRSDAARYELQNRLEASLGSAREHEARLQQEVAERKRLGESLDEARRELQEQSQKHDLLQQELKTANEALQDREARLQKETAERQQLAEALGVVQRGSLGNPDRDLEFSKVQSALQSEQVERQRQESQMARMRQTAVDAAHAARSLRTGLRRQIREPVDNLIHSTRSLLELEMGEEQKKLAEAVLQDVLLVQTRLREPGLAQPEAAESNGAANPAEK
jgi:chromosome segregation ATPase